MRYARTAILLVVAYFTASAWAGTTHTVYVSPPSGTDDTIVLQGALDTCMQLHPKGCTIQLTAGTYKSKQLISENFHGQLKGMGTDVTTIEVLAPLEVTVSTENVFDKPPSRTNKYPFLITFLAGDIAVSDFTVKVNDFNAATPWCYGSSGCGQTWLKGLVGVYGTTANLFVTRMGFEGGPGTNDGRNYDNGPFFTGTSGLQQVPLTGTFKLTSTRCRFAGNCWEVFGVSNSNIVVGGSPLQGILVEDGEYGGLMGDIDNSVVEYSYNNVTVNDYSFYSTALWAAQGILSNPRKPSQFLVHHNQFNITGLEEGVFFGDLTQSNGLGKSADIFIFNNLFSLASSDEGLGWAGVELYSTVDSVVTGNVFSGTAYNGIAIESGSKCALLANDFSGFMGQQASVFLDPGTSGCLVVGNGRPTLVLDQGTNDTLINVTNMPLPAAANAAIFGAPAQVPRGTPRLP
jgi:parallel beta-helix repeat protein